MKPMINIILIAIILFATYALFQPKKSLINYNAQSREIICGEGGGNGYCIASDLRGGGTGNERRISALEDKNN